MGITTRTIGKCKVLDCSGPFTLGPETEALRKAIRELVLDDTLRVVLNIGNVSDMDLAGFAEMITGYVHVTNLGSKLVFLNPTEKFCKLLINAKILTVFEIYDDEQKALEGCE